jgi:5-methylcytosine-specific restriction endonuclease McrA
MPRAANVSARRRFEILKRDGFRCVYCGCNPTQRLLHVDHVVAVANGGTNAPENLVTACEGCSAVVRNKTKERSPR